MTTYRDKLDDPRWQRRRLEIFQRDDWTCQKCGSTTKTLHVHHKRYLPGVDPWDSPAEDLETQCADCHEKEDSSVRAMMRDLKEKWQAVRARVVGEKALHTQ